MQIRDIEYVAAVAEYHSFSRAAEKLFISQPALSQQILHLEDELQVQLFKRENKQVTPTLACEAFLEDGRTILALSRRIKERMAEFADLNAGELKIAISSFYHRSYLPPFMKRFQKRYPNVKINVVDAFSNEQSKLLLQGEVDLGIASLPLMDSRLAYAKLFEEDILLAIHKDSHVNDYFKNKDDNSLTIEDLNKLRSESFIMCQKGRNLRDISIAICHKAGFEPNIVYETPSCEHITEMILQDIGLGVVPRRTIEAYPPDRRPRYYRILDDISSQTFVLAYREGALSRAAQAFYSIMTEND